MVGSRSSWGEPLQLHDLANHPAGEDEVVVAACDWWLLDREVREARDDAVASFEDFGALRRSRVLALRVLVL